MAGNNLAWKWNKTADSLFSGYDIRRTRKNYFLSGFLDFFVIISTLAKDRVEILTKKLSKPRQKVDFPKISSSPLLYH